MATREGKIIQSSCGNKEHRLLALIETIGFDSHVAVRVRHWGFGDTRASLPHELVLPSAVETRSFAKMLRDAAKVVEDLGDAMETYDWESQ